MGNIVGSTISVSGGAQISLNDVHLDYEGLYRLRVKAAPDFNEATGNYTLSLYDVTLDIHSLSFGEVAVGSIENPFDSDRWDFTAVEDQQIRFDLRAASGSNVVFSLTGPNGFVGFTDTSVSSELITLPASGHYSVTAHGQQGVTGQYSFQLIENVPTELTLGQAITRVNGGPGSTQLFRVQVPEAKPLVFRMDDSFDGNRSIFYVRYGAPPTLTEFDHTTVNPRSGNITTADVKGSADPTLVVPNAFPGDWYLLVYGNWIPTLSTYSVEAVTSEAVISRVSPDKFGAVSNVELTLTGAGFVSGAAVQLIGTNNNVVAVAANVEIGSYSQLYATFSLNGVSPGTYDVRVSLPGDVSDTYPMSFTVLPNGEAHLETRLIMPNALGRHSTGTIYVEYANTGTVSMAAPLLRLQSSDPDNSDRPILTLDQSIVTQGFWSSSIPAGFAESIQILASGASPGLLSPGERIVVPVYYVGLAQPWDFSDSQIEMEIRIFDSNNRDAIPWATLEEELRPSIVLTDAWRAIFTNLTANVGGTWGQFVEMLSENAVCLNRLGRHVVDVSELWSFEVQQAIGFTPIRTVASAIDASIVAPGGELSFGRFWSVSFEQRFASSFFGRGWSTPWETRLIVEPDGTVNIVGAGGDRRRFEPDSRYVTYFDNLPLGRAAFFSSPGESGNLIRLAGGGYELREQSGSLTRFRTNGQIDYTQDANGNRVTASYDGTSRLVSLTHSSGAAISIQYNSNGLIQSMQDSAGRVTSFTYDALFEYLMSTIGPDGIVTSYTYDRTPNSPRRHSLTSVTTGDVTQVFHYYERGLLASVGTRVSSTLETARISFQYDSVGKVSVSDLAGATTQLFYDERGLLLRVTDPLGNVTNAEYGDDLRISRIIDPLGQSQAFTWCGCGSLASTTDQLGHKTTFMNEYVGPNDTVRRMTSVTDANGNATRFTYDSYGNLTSTIYADGSVERQLAFDPTGDLLTHMNRRGQVMSYTYNAAGQVTRQTFHDGTFIAFAYDPRGNLVRIDEPGNRVTAYEYDAGDRMTRVLYPEGHLLEFMYDISGRRTSMTDETGYTLKYAYDVAGRLFRLTDGVGDLIVEYLYDNVGRLSRKYNGNGTYTEYAYDIAGRLLSIFNRATNDAINSSFIYTYDAMGRRTSMTTIDGVWRYGYDAAGQLTRSVYSPAIDTSSLSREVQYYYDAVGNRTQTLENGVATEYSTNALNQYTRVGEETLKNDPDGNLVARTSALGDTVLTYDQSGRLTRVTTGDVVWTNQYTVFSHRSATSMNGDSIQFVLDPIGIIDVVGEYSSAGELLTRYHHGLGLVSQGRTYSDSRYYDYDAMGNTSGITGPQGIGESDYGYDPFGAQVGNTRATSTRFGFGGQFGVSSEEFGLSYMRARFYDAQLGRFVSADPIRLNGGDVNLYRFAANDPNLNSDPEGLMSCPFQVTLALRITGGLVGFAIGGFIGGMPGAVIGAWRGIRLGATTFPQSLAASGAAFGLAKALCLLFPPDGTSPTPGGGAPGDSGGAGSAGSRDPNELIGPAGSGQFNFVDNSSTLTYRINFENYGPGSVEHDGMPSPESRWATAPAQQVEIVNILPVQLDLATFAVTGFGFGDMNVVLPIGASHHSQSVQIAYNGKSFEVLFEADLDRNSNTLRVRFLSIDPLTQLPPDVMTGFLPPEDGTGRGKGFITYVARSVTGLVTGTEIRNVALISFDDQLEISTDQIDPLDPSLGVDPARQALVTIDAGLPVAVMTGLPAISDSAEFVISWSGEDDLGGAGVRSYDIFVAKDGGDWLPLLANTTDTSTTFHGVANSTYEFAAVATDNVGHVEAGGLAPEAKTQIVLPNSAPTDIEISNAVIDENKPVGTIVGIFSTTDPEAENVFKYILVDGSGGADNSRFMIDETGNLLTTEILDFETRSVLTIRVRTTDQGSLSFEKQFTVSVLPKNDNVPVFSSPTTFTVSENSNIIGAVVATDADLPAQFVNYSIAGGADAAKFAVDSNGNLIFTSAPDFENPQDVGANNVYQVRVTANDGNGGTSNQDITVTVILLNDNDPIFASPARFAVPENTAVVGTMVAFDEDLPAQSISFTITGGMDAARFLIAGGNELRFAVAPDFENPGDADANNVYHVQVSASDGDGGFSLRNIEVNVTRINDNVPVFSSPLAFTVAENLSSVGTVVASDADLPAQFVDYSITGGADAAKFAIASDGRLVFTSAPDFENPQDVGGNNVYDLQVTADDGQGGLTTQVITVTVTAMNDHNPVFTSGAVFDSPENSTAIGTLAATDADLPLQGISFSISGGLDAAQFVIGNNGELTFAVAPDFEQPADSNSDNIYQLVVTAADGLGGLTVQDITVVVTDVNEVVIGPQLELGPAVTFTKKQAPAFVLPQIVVSGSSVLGGGSLVLSMSLVGSKRKLLDQVLIPDHSPLGSSPGLQMVNRQLTVEIQLNASATNASIQTFLRGITFATKGKGLKTLTRNIQLTLTDSSGASNTATQKINLRKKVVAR